MQQNGRNIELIRYRRFGADLLLLESVNGGSDSNGKATGAKLAKASASKLEVEGTGNLEVPLTSQVDLDAFKPFINATYEGKG